MVSNKELTASTKYLYMVIATTIPGSITELSIRTGMSGGSLSTMCKGLARYGFIKFIENGCAKPIVACVPEEVEYGEISNEYIAAMRKKTGVEFRPRPDR